MIVEFQQYIEQHKLCNTNNGVLLAVSGGIDSIVMLDLFVRTNYKTAIAHCNFQLRGVESEDDEKFVRDLGEKMGLTVFSKKFETRNYAAKYKLSIQVAARELRYVWFEELSKKEGFDYIAVAHHSDDQVETFFINLLRGSGLVGLKGMPLKRDRIIRPLLFAKREYIETYARVRNLSFREDSSNKEDTYLRNKIRLNLITELEKIDKKAPDAIIRSTKHLSDADVLLQQLLDEKFKSVFRIEKGIYYMSMDTIKDMQPLEIWMYYLLRNFNFNRDITDNICEAIIEKQSGKTFYSITHIAIIDRNSILIESIKDPDTKVYCIKAEQETITKPISLKLQTSPNNEVFKMIKKPNVAYLDKEKLRFPLKLRKWKKGDRFQPIGMKGSKLLSDYFIDNKFNLIEKQNIWLLVSGEDIVWIIGHRISEKYKITKQTVSVLSVTEISA